MSIFHNPDSEFFDPAKSVKIDRNYQTLEILIIDTHIGDLIFVNLMTHALTGMCQFVGEVIGVSDDGDVRITNRMLNTVFDMEPDSESLFSVLRVSDVLMNDGKRFVVNPEDVQVRSLLRKQDKGKM